MSARWTALHRARSRAWRIASQGFSARNLKNFRQVVLTWPDLDPRQVLYAVLGPNRQTASADLLEFRQTSSAESTLDLHAPGFPSLTARALVTPVNMHVYLNWIAENLTKPDERSPAGLLLCAGKDGEKVHYATANLPRAVFVSRYLTALPSEERLSACPLSGPQPRRATKNR